MNNIQKASLTPAQSLFHAIYGYDNELELTVDFQEAIELIKYTLTPREYRVLELRFGLENNQPKTLKEVAIPFFVTEERIRQIEAKSLRKIRREIGKMLNFYIKTCH